MRLKYLWVENYKNLKDFCVDFSAGNGLTLLIGTNGSGKSNIIEALSKIFSSIKDGVVKRNDLGCNFLLCYSNTDGNYFLAGKGKNAILAEVFYNIDADRNRKHWASQMIKAKEYGFSNLIDTLFGGKRFTHQETLCTVNKTVKLQNNIPNVIAIYSGEETRLWDEIFEAPYKRYIKHTGKTSNNILQMTYLNRFYWELALFVLYFSGLPSNDVYLKTQIGVTGVEKVCFTINRKNLDPEKTPLLLAFIDRLFNENDGYIELTDEQIRERICDEGALFTEGLTQSNDGTTVLPSEIRKILYLPSREIMQILIQACLPKSKKVIEKMEIHFSNGMTTRSLSEGEKKLLLIKCALDIGANENTLLLMDEPDAHIHESRKKDIFNLLKEYNNTGRQVVVTSHSPSFIEIAERETIIFIKRDSNGNSIICDTEKVESIRFLTGSRFNAFLEKPILYCEGTISSLEEKLYPILFPDYLVMPCGGHEEVISNVRLYNRTFANETNKAIGIIDWDYKSEEQLTSLRNDGIYSLNVLELENVLMDFDLLDKMRRQCLGAEDGLNQLITYFINDCKQNDAKQAAKHTSNLIVSQIKSSLTSENRDFERFKNNVSQICDVETMENTYQERLQKLREYIATRNYEELYKIFDFNHKIDRFVTNGIVDDYENRVLRLISNDSEVREMLISKYFPGISNV